MAEVINNVLHAAKALYDRLQMVRGAAVGLRVLQARVVRVCATLEALRQQGAQAAPVGGPRLEGLLTDLAQTLHGASTWIAEQGTPGRSGFVAQFWQAPATVKRVETIDAELSRLVQELSASMTVALNVEVARLGATVQAMWGSLETSQRLVLDLLREREVKQPPAARLAPATYEDMVGLLQLASEVIQGTAGMEARPDAAEVAAVWARQGGDARVRHEASGDAVIAWEELTRPGEELADALGTTTTEYTYKYERVNVKQYPLKGVWSSAEQQKALAKMAREAEAQSQVRSSRLVRVLGIAHDETHCRIGLVTELMDGSVQSLLEGGVLLDAPKRLDFVRQAAEGLAALHSEEIVHGDVRPATLHHKGMHRVAWADFGFSAVKERFVANTTAKWNGYRADGRVAPFLAPELLEVDPAAHRYVNHPSKASDVYGWGLTAWCVLAGVSVPAVDRLRAGEHPDLARVPEALRPVLLQCWARDPATRPPMHAVAAAVATTFAGALPSAPPAEEDPTDPVLSRGAIAAASSQTASGAAAMPAAGGVAAAAEAAASTRPAGLDDIEDTLFLYEKKLSARLGAAALEALAGDAAAMVWLCRNGKDCVATAIGALLLNPTDAGALADTCKVLAAVTHEPDLLPLAAVPAAVDVLKTALSGGGDGAASLAAAQALARLAAAQPAVAQPAFDALLAALDKLTQAGAVGDERCLWTLLALDGLMRSNPQCRRAATEGRVGLQTLLRLLSALPAADTNTLPAALVLAISLATELPRCSLPEAACEAAVSTLISVALSVLKCRTAAAASRHASFSLLALLAETPNNRQRLGTPEVMMGIIGAMNTAPPPPPELLSHGCRFIASMAASAMLRSSLAEANAVEAVVHSLQCSSAATATLTRYALAALANLSTSSAARRRCLATGGLRTAATAMDGCPTSVPVARYGLAFFANMAQQIDPEALVASGALDRTLRALAAFPADADVLVQGTYLLTYIAHHAAYRGALVERGAAATMVSIILSTPACAEDVAAACCAALASLLEESYLQARLVDEGTIRALLVALDRHSRVSSLAAHCCTGLALLAEQGQHLDAVAADGCAVRAAVRALSECPEYAALAVPACALLAKLSSLGRWVPEVSVDAVQAISKSLKGIRSGEAASKVAGPGCDALARLAATSFVRTALAGTTGAVLVSDIISAADTALRAHKRDSTIARSAVAVLASLADVAAPALMKKATLVTLLLNVVKDAATSPAGAALAEVGCAALRRLAAANAASAAALAALSADPGAAPVLIAALNMPGAGPRLCEDAAAALIAMWVAAPAAVPLSEALAAVVKAMARPDTAPAVLEAGADMLATVATSSDANASLVGGTRGAAAAVVAALKLAVAGGPAARPRVTKLVALLHKLAPSHKRPLVEGGAVPVLIQVLQASLADAGGLGCEPQVCAVLAETASLTPGAQAVPLPGVQAVLKAMNRAGAPAEQREACARVLCDVTSLAGAAGDAPRALIAAEGVPALLVAMQAASGGDVRPAAVAQAVQRACVGILASLASIPALLAQALQHRGCLEQLAAVVVALPTDEQLCAAAAGFLGRVAAAPQHLRQLRTTPAVLAALKAVLQNHSRDPLFSAAWAVMVAMVDTT